MSNTVPSGWSVHELGDLAHRIEGGGTPSRTEASFWNGDIPWATVKDLRAVSLRSTEEHITELGLKNSSSKLIPANTIIIATRMAVGKAVFFDRDVAINQDLKAFCPKSGTNWRFLLQWYLAQSEKVENLATGSTVKGIRLDELKLLPIDLPPLSEQQKIAAILSSVDDVIEKTRAQIDKLKDLKTGMMQELLTKGIGSGGVPHTEFKDSPVGRIPAAWHDSTLKELCTVITKGTTPTTYGNNYTETGINFIKVECISRDGVLDSSKFSFIDEQTHQKLSRSRLEEGDILITIAGATVGKLAIVRREHLPANTNQALAVARTDESKVLRDFVYYWLQSAFIKNSISNIQTVGAQPNLSLSQIGNFLIALPELKEQQKIVCSLSGVDDLTALKRKKLVAAELTKKALMQDLLTGKVRVKVDQKESAVA